MKEYIKLASQYKFIIFLLMASLVKYLVIHYLSDVSKLLYALFIWASVFSFPFRDFNTKGFPKFARFLLTILFVSAIYSIVSVPFNDNSHVPGNIMVSLFMNELCSLLYYPILFIGIARTSKYFKNINYALLLGCLLSIIEVLYSNISIIQLMYFSILFYPIIRNEKKIFWLINIVFVLKALNIIGDARVDLMFFLISIAAYLCVYKFKSKILSKYMLLALLVLPFVGLYLMYICGISPFELLDSKLSSAEFRGDSRTFLYQEVVTDLIDNDSLFLGKGALSIYFSEYFENAKFDANIYRICVEVPMLNFLLKNGLIFTISLTLLLLGATIRGFVRSKNKYMRSVSLLVAGIFLIMFVGDINGCRLFQATMWFCVGMLLTDSWLNMSDDEIEQKLL